MADNISQSGEIAPTEYFRVTNIHFLQAPIDDRNFFPYIVIHKSNIEMQKSTVYYYEQLQEYLKCSLACNLQHHLMPQY